MNDDSTVLSAKVDDTLAELLEGERGLARALRVLGCVIARAARGIEFIAGRRTAIRVLRELTAELERTGRH